MMTSRQFNQSSLALSRCLANGRFRRDFSVHDGLGEGRLTTEAV